MWARKDARPGAGASKMRLAVAKGVRSRIHVRQSIRTLLLRRRLYRYQDDLDSTRPSSPN